MRTNRKLLAVVTVVAATAAMATITRQAQVASAQPAPATRVSAAQRAPLTAKGPVGWDTYRRLGEFDRLPQGVETKQFSSFERAGGNGDFNRCLATRADGSCVLAKATGAGEVDSIWSTRDGGDVTRTGDITVVLDGKTVLHAPFQDVVDGRLGAPFVYPVVANADQSSGGVNILAPMTYRRSMLVYVDHDPNYYHVTYRSFADAKGVNTFDPSDKATDVIATLKAAGTRDPKPTAAGARTVRHTGGLAPGRSTRLATVRGAGSVSALRLSVPGLAAPPKPDLVSDDGRAFGAGGYSQFTVKIDPANTGVRIVRRADDGIGHQRATVSVDGKQVAQWQPNEVAGSCKWKDEYVDLPASATAGKSSITVRNTFVSSDLDFNEFRYTIRSSSANGSTTTTDSVDVGPDHIADEKAHDYTIVKQTFQGRWQYCYDSDKAADPKVVASNDIVRDVRVRVDVDGRRTVDAPLGQFFGNGQTADSVRSLMTRMGADGRFAAWWPMPYARKISVSLYNGSHHKLSSVRSSVSAAPDRSVRDELATGRIGYFRATSREADTTPAQDYRFLNASGTGKFVGVAHSMRGPLTRAYLEGDERVYVDGAQSPALHGTGTEDYYEGGWYFNRDTFSDPANGEPAHQSGADYCAADSDCSSVYRLMLTDSVPFGSSLDFGIEHGPVDDVAAHYGSTAFWYGRAAFTKRVTDTVDAGNARSERSHHYRGGTRSTLTGTYEGDNGPQLPVTDDLRTSTGKVSFRVALDRKNRGAVLRRSSDQAKPGQQARVAVDARTVGTWTQPLDNTTHRWLDDTFALPQSATTGRRSVTVTLTPTAGSAPWTAARYVAQSVVAPFADRHAPSAPRDVTAAGGDSNAITVSWSPAGDDTGIARYVVHGAKNGGAFHRLGSTTRTGFAHTGLGLKEHWTYRVVAVDLAGHQSRASGTASARTGAALRVEAEQQLPAVESTALADSQGSCCGVAWSGGAQLWFHATGAGQHVTIAFTVPTTGKYAMTSVQTKAGDYGITTLALDGTPVGNPVDGYHAGGVVLTDPADDGTHQLSAGRHTVTLTVTGRNAAAAGYFAGLDHLDLRLVG